MPYFYPLQQMSKVDRQRAAATRFLWHTFVIRTLCEANILCEVETANKPEIRLLSEAEFASGSEILKPMTYVLKTISPPPRNT